MELHAGHHVVVQLLGLNVNLDTLMMTWLVAALVIIVTVSATRGRSLVPSGLQNAMEMVIESLLDQFRETLGPKYGQVVSVLLTMFLFILFANELGMIPNPEILASPTNDLNTTVALALVSSFMVHFMALKNQGFKKHFKSFFKPFAPFVIINLMEEITKPLTLAFRLFGNILAGEILLEVLYFLVPIGIPIIWLVFSLVIGLIQAFIFTILTTSYLAPSFSDDYRAGYCFTLKFSSYSQKLGGYLLWKKLSYWHCPLLVHAWVLVWQLSALLSVTVMPHRRCLKVRLVSLKWAANSWLTCLSPSA